jgi:hypothetical protein
MPDEMPRKFLIISISNLNERTFMPVLYQAIVDSIRWHLRSHKGG